MYVAGWHFCCFFFFVNDTATTEIYTLSLHDALPISARCLSAAPCGRASPVCSNRSAAPRRDRKSTRLNSSHITISYAVFCLQKQIAERHPEVGEMLAEALRLGGYHVDLV